MAETYGRRVHGEISSSDITTATAVVWRDQDNNLVTLGASQHLEIDWISAHVNTGASIFFFLGSGTIEAAGELVCKWGAGNVNTVGFIAFPEHSRPRGAAGKPLKADASAASLTRISVGAHIFG